MSISNNVITGAPTTAGTYTFTLEAISSDSVGGQARPLKGLTQFTITISPTP